jgi:hypothetical protein
MRRTHIVLSAALALLLAVGASAGDKAKGKKAKPVTGVVTEVTKDKDSGTIKVKVVAKKKGGAEPAEKTYTVTQATKFEKQVGTKKAGDLKTSGAKFGEVKKGDRVAVTAKGDVAQAVKILPAKKKAK